MSLVLDFAWGRPTVASIKAKGATGIVQYVGSTNHSSSRNGKFITPADVKKYHAGGLDIAVVFETSAGRPNGGRAAGLADAKVAQADLLYAGLPSTLPVYFALDQDDTVGPLVSAYYGACQEVLGKGRVGAYAGIKVIKALLDKGLISYAWQTLAWSGGKWDARNNLEQYQIEVKVGGVDCDLNRTKKADWGQYRASGVTPTPAPTPTPVPTPAPAPSPASASELDLMQDLGLLKGQEIAADAARTTLEWDKEY